MANQQDMNAAELQRIVDLLRTNPGAAAAMAPALRKLRSSIGRFQAPGTGLGAVQCAGHCISHCISHPPGGDIFTAEQPQPV